MFYKKNLPGWKRALRVAAGVGMVGFGLFGGLPDAVIGYAIAGTGVIALLTGFVGFCPMCAMAGRKLDR
jgi:hypothetical protein